MGNNENLYEISQDVKNSLKVVKYNYERYCNEVQVINKNHNIYGGKYLVKKIEISLIYISLTIDLYYGYDKYEIALIYDSNDKLVVSCEDDIDKLPFESNVTEVLEYLFDMYVPNDIWEVKAMLN